eukprot:1000279-Rhodomonas_salina.1
MASPPCVTFSVRVCRPWPPRPFHTRGSMSRLSSRQTGGWTCDARISRRALVISGCLRRGMRPLSPSLR